LKILRIIFVLTAVCFRHCQDSIAVAILHTTQINIATLQPEVKLRLYHISPRR